MAKVNTSEYQVFLDMGLNTLNTNSLEGYKYFKMQSINTLESI